MVVVPTSHEVTLHYGTTNAELTGWLLTLGAAIAAVGMTIVGRKAKRRVRRGVGHGIRTASLADLGRPSSGAPRPRA
jgi:hypothetical protein